MVDCSLSMIDLLSDELKCLQTSKDIYHVKGTTQEHIEEASQSSLV